MGTFNRKEILAAPPTIIPEIADRLIAHFQEKEYDTAKDELSSGGCEISITKGNFFKAILGMRTALKISLLPQGNNIAFEAQVGIFGKQVIPTLIMWYVAWPVLLTQIWGLIQQSKLDDEAISVIKEVIDKNTNVIDITPTATAALPSGHKFCTNCGTKNGETAKFCCGCGSKM